MTLTLATPRKTLHELNASTWLFVQMLHVGRTKGPGSDCKLGKSLMADLTKRDSFYATPKGSNDDWWVSHP